MARLARRALLIVAFYVLWHHNGKAQSSRR